MSKALVGASKMEEGRNELKRGVAVVLALQSESGETTFDGRTLITFSEEATVFTIPDQGVDAFPGSLIFDAITTQRDLSAP